MVVARLVFSLYSYILCSSLCENLMLRKELNLIGTVSAHPLLFGETSKFLSILKFCFNLETPPLKECENTSLPKNAIIYTDIVVIHVMFSKVHSCECNC